MGRLATHATELIEKVLKKAKAPLTMSEVLEAVIAYQAKNKAPHPISRRDVYNAIHNNVGARFKAGLREGKSTYALA